MAASVDLDRPSAPVVDPAHRLRRTRRTPSLRALVRETRVHPRQLVAPIFVQPGRGIRSPISSLPSVDRVSPDEAAADVARYVELGLGGVILFGLPAAKDTEGSGAWIEDGIVQETLRGLRTTDPDLVLIADTCLCEYTAHGHCGPILPDGSVDNDAAIERLAATAVSQARAGADVVAPSAMMDGQVAAIRTGLDAAGFTGTSILAYAAKTASAYYGPFREAADSAPAFGDRRGYQMDPANFREAMREMAIDVDESADALLVKPAMPSLDILAAARARFELPIAAYQVSGEYAQIEAAAQLGWIDRRRTHIEALTSIVRAGADIVITYAAADLATWLREGTDR
ncbi:MAG: porphobilinogen synthase [Chloroflexota bacterium]|nr:MAG: porphobilinogen synthase [Chloroflexota bacterium]